MCSLTESELEPELVRARLDPKQVEVCKKCRIKRPTINLRVNDVYCKECFLTAVHHKFRATLGKNKAMRPGEQVCVAYSGGGASASLLHLLKTGLESDHKRLLFVPSVLHVDEGALRNLSHQQRTDSIRTRCEEAGRQGFPVYFSLLEQPDRVVRVNDPDHISVDFCDKLGDRLLSAVENIKENSAKEDFINTIRRGAILSGAAAMNCGKVFTAEHGTKISIDLLAGVALGKGINLSHETGFRDTRDSRVMLLRPLRDVSGKELALYAQLHKLDYSPDPTISTGKDNLYSIRKLTEDFLVGLQADFPATLSTVFKTGDKLQVDASESRESCALCEGPLDTEEDEEHCALQASTWSTIVSIKGKKLGEDILTSSALRSLDLSQLRSEFALGDGQAVNGNCVDKEDECCGQGDGSCKTNKPRPLLLKDVLPLLCYSCMRTVASFKSLENLPLSLRDKIQTKRNRIEMKSEIQDFLL